MSGEIGVCSVCGSTVESCSNEEGLEKELALLKKIIEVQGEGLEYYANKFSWYLHKDKLCEVRRSIEYADTESYGVQTETGENYLEVLGGKRARQALEEVERLRSER